MGIFKEIKVINTGMIKSGDFIHLKYKAGVLSDKVYNGLVTKVTEKSIKVHICIDNELDDIEVTLDETLRGNVGFVTAASLTYVNNTVNWNERDGLVSVGLSKKDSPK